MVSVASVSVSEVVVLALADCLEVAEGYCLKALKGLDACSRLRAARALWSTPMLYLERLMMGAASPRLRMPEPMDCDAEAGFSADARDEVRGAADFMRALEEGAVNDVDVVVMPVLVARGAGGSEVSMVSLVALNS